MKWFSVFVLAALPVFAANAPKIALEPFVSNVEFPVDVQHDGTKRLLVLEQRGRIRLIENGQLQSQSYLDIRDRVKFGGECGLLGLAFHPDFARNGRFFVNYTTTADDWRLTTRISEFHADPRAATVDAGTERIVMKYEQPWSNHNGGCVTFGPDKMLYIAAGDGGAAGDPLNSGQRLTTYLGKILRIDVDHQKPYAIPADNPFAGKPGVRGEIWAYGLRNPWRFCFDPLTKLLYAADVGQDHWEEIDIVEPGKNYGWNIMEGLHDFKADRPKTDLVSPIKEYPHGAGNDSITGGFVYRGKRFPSLVGWYLYADYDGGNIWGLRYEDGHVTADALLLKAPVKISSFGQDVDGELYVCSHYDNAVLRLVALPR